MWFYGGFRGPRSSDDRRGNGAGLAIVIAIGLIVVAYVLSFVIRLALSRSRELLADAGSVELTKNPDAMISALRKIEGRGELPGPKDIVKVLFASIRFRIDPTQSPFDRLRARQMMVADHLPERS